MKISNESSNWVSPYLTRPLRSIEEVLAERAKRRAQAAAQIKTLSSIEDNPSQLAPLLSLDAARMARRQVA